MRKKELLIVGLCMFSVCTLQANFEKPMTTPSYYKVESIPDRYERMILHGELATSIGPNAIEAGSNDDEVYIQFNQGFGNVNIAIYNSNGQQVYSTVVDTSVQQVVIIPFTTAAADTYTVELSHADGYAEGDFEKN